MRAAHSLAPSDLSWLRWSWPLFLLGELAGQGEVALDVGLWRLDRLALIAPVLAMEPGQRVLGEHGVLALGHLPGDVRGGGGDEQVVGDAGLLERGPVGGLTLLAADLLGVGLP